MIEVKDIIYDIISNDEAGKTLKYNELTKKIEINGHNIDEADVFELMFKVKQQLPKEIFKQSLFTSKIMKMYIEKYALLNKYTPAIKKSEWFSTINTNTKGEVLHTLENTVNFLKNYPEYKGKFSYNEFTAYENFDEKMISDADIVKFRLKCEQELGFEQKEKVESAVKYLCNQNSFNPFKTALENIIWDGEPRMEEYFIKYLGVDDNKYNRSFTVKWFYALIKRLYEPGCPFDCMLIVYDKTQGTGKSKIIEYLIGSLGINYGYDLSITCDNKDKDNIDKINKAWVVGIDELGDFLKKNPEQCKQFLSQSSDVARLSYEKRSTIYYRHCVFYGNSNMEYFLKDYTSNFERRYWVMEATGTKNDSNWWTENMPASYCQQVLAEAKYFYDTNPDFVYNVLNKEETEWLQKIQYKHKTLQNDDILQDKILKILNLKYTYDINQYSYEKWRDYVKSNINTDDIAITTNNLITEIANIDTKVYYLQVKWLKQYIHEELNRNITTQYINALIEIDGWSYKQVKINSKPIYVYYKQFGG